MIEFRTFLVKSVIRDKRPSKRLWFYVIPIGNKFTRKIRSIFKSKDKNIHPSELIYKGTCSCGSVYIKETKRNLSARTNEHKKPLNETEPARHLNKGQHSFSWNVVMTSKHIIKSGSTLFSTPQRFWAVIPCLNLNFSRYPPSSLAKYRAFSATLRHLTLCNRCASPLSKSG